MSALDRFARIAAETGAPAWHRYRDAATGLSFEVPVEIVDVAAEGPFETLAEGRMTVPFAFDVTFLVSREASDAPPEALARDMATQWIVDYDLASGPSVRCVAYPGVEEAWSLSAEIRDDAGPIDLSWVTLRKGGKVGCLGVSCWSVEDRGREAWFRTLRSVSGDWPD